MTEKNTQKVMDMSNDTTRNTFHSKNQIYELLSLKLQHGFVDIPAVNHNYG